MLGALCACENRMGGIHTQMRTGAEGGSFRQELNFRQKKMLCRKKNCKQCVRAHTQPFTTALGSQGIMRIN